MDNHEDADIRNQFLSLAVQLSVSLSNALVPQIWPSNIADFGRRVVEQPFKIPFIAAIVLIINQTKPEVAQKILAKAGIIIQEHLDAGAWREVKLVLRFLGCLQGLLEGDGVFPVLEELFSRAVDLQTASSEDVSTLVMKANREQTLISTYPELGLRACEDHPAYNTIRYGIFSKRL